MKKKIFLAVFTAIMLMCGCAYGFSDVKEGSWYYDNAEYMSQQGYLSGYGDGTFRPSGIITKAEFVSVVCRTAGIKWNQRKSENGENSHWAKCVMEAAMSEGLYDWDEIPPSDGSSYDEPITRQLAVKVVMKAFLPDKRGDYNRVHSAVKDFAQLDGRYYDSVIAAYCEGIVYGDDNGNLNPKDSLTRAEACAIIMRAANKRGGLTPYETAAPDTAKPVSSRKGGVTENGKLHVEGTQLVNERGEAVVLHGMSSHGLQWYGNFTSPNAIAATADYGANLFRCAMYTAEGGYISDRSVKDTLINAVDSAIRQDMYVIIDWHILSDGDPLMHADEAAEFFAEMSRRYGDNPAVLYEICNEPNGNITWDGNVKPYAERIIPVIRANSDGIILAGSPTWSQDLHEAAKNPLSGENIMYTCHFYAGTHTGWLRERIAGCGLPVFVSEWGTSAADGNGGVYSEEAQKWIDFMNEHSISWANWSYCDKNETSAALVSGADADDGIAENELTQSGRFVFGNF